MSSFVHFVYRSLGYYISTFLSLVPETPISAGKKTRHVNVHQSIVSGRLMSPNILSKLPSSKREEQIGYQCSAGVSLVGYIKGIVIDIKEALFIITSDWKLLLGDSIQPNKLSEE